MAAVAALLPQSAAASYAALSEPYSVLLPEVCRNISACLFLACMCAVCIGVALNHATCAPTQRKTPPTWWKAALGTLRGGGSGGDSIELFRRKKSAVPISARLCISGVVLCALLSAHAAAPAGWQSEALPARRASTEARLSRGSGGRRVDPVPAPFEERSCGRPWDLWSYASGVYLYSGALGATLLLLAFLARRAARGGGCGGGERGGAAEAGRAEGCEGAGSTPCLNSTRSVGATAAPARRRRRIPWHMRGIAAQKTRLRRQGAGWQRAVRVERARMHAERAERQQRLRRRRRRERDERRAEARVRVGFGFAAL
eukprot:gene5551-18054_t